MIIRIVKMTFHPEKVNDFLNLFTENKHHIRNFDGCSNLQLLNDINRPFVFFTYSYWNNEQSLEKYRQSELFNQVWSKTKVLFSDKPEAWSLTEK
jgi:quinol monooxygenase YgiN